MQSHRLCNSSGTLEVFTLRVIIILYAHSFSPTVSRCWSLFVAHPLLVFQHNRDDVWILLSANLQWKAFFVGYNTMHYTNRKSRCRANGYKAPTYPHVLDKHWSEMGWENNFIPVSRMSLLLFFFFFNFLFLLMPGAAGTNELHAIFYVLFKAKSTLSCFF